MARVRTSRPTPSVAPPRAVVERVDWDCEVQRNFSDVNLGCGMRPATGLTWVFKHVDRAIVLEADCVPDPTFFRFCDEALERYRDDERVMHVAGNNFSQGRRFGASNYFLASQHLPRRVGHLGACLAELRLRVETVAGPAGHALAGLHRRRTTQRGGVATDF